MDPVIALPYSEYVAANELARLFISCKGYSVFAPLSRQEKGVDLLLTRTEGSKRTAVTFQVKSSRTYARAPPKREATIAFNYYTWFNRFDVSERADFYLLVAFYANNHRLTAKRIAPNWWQSLILLFSNDEMKTFLENVRTKTGKHDRMFGFGFNSESEIFLTRGDGEYRPTLPRKAYTEHLLRHRFPTLQAWLHG